MNVREITKADYNNLISFWEDNYFINEVDSQEKFELFLDKNPNLSILAEENEKIIGTALGSFDGRRGYLQKVVTRKDLRGKGIGKTLVDEVLKRLKSLGVTYIPISCDQDNVSFYESSGFKVSKAVPMNINFSEDNSYDKYKDTKK